MGLVLGSSSPRRREMLDLVGVPYTACTPPFDERSFVHEGKLDVLVRLLAEEKCASLIGDFPEDVILCADTLVIYKDQHYGKPEDPQEAFAMLKTLAGQTHQVLTGVAVRRGDEVLSELESTSVTLKSMSDDQIRIFHQAIHPFDKAGSYAIQGLGALIVERIEGNYDNVLGLPMQTCMRLLSKMGINLWDYITLRSSA